MEAEFFLASGFDEKIAHLLRAVIGRRTKIIFGDLQNYVFVNLFFREETKKLHIERINSTFPLDFHLFDFHEVIKDEENLVSHFFTFFQRDDGRVLFNKYNFIYLCLLLLSPRYIARK